MDVKSTITTFFGKIRKFNFLSVLLEKKLKSIKKDMKLNEELKTYYEKEIYNAKNTIEKSKQKIEIIEMENKKMEEYIADINKVFE